MLLKISLFVFFLIGSGFFSSAETAVTAINKIKLRHLLDQGQKGSNLLSSLLEQPRKLLATILIGNNLANVSATVLFTSVALDLLQQYQLGPSKPIMAGVTAGLTYILLITGEVFPKTAALKNPESLALAYAKPLRGFQLIFGPVLWLTDLITQALQRTFGVDTSNIQKMITEEEFKYLVSVGEKEGILEKEEKDMINSIVDFSETIIREIMTPRTDVFFVENTQTVQDAINVILDKGHSRIPVFEEKIDNTVGIVYAKDLLKVPHNSLNETLHKYYRQAVYTPETTSVETLLQKMKQEKFHISIIVDEHGGVSGIVTLEDILEEIVGEIQDEYDQDERPLFNPTSNNHYLVDAKINIQDLGQKLDIEFPNDDDYDTLGGFLLSMFGQLPTKGDRIQYQNLEFIVKELSKRRIKTIEIIKKDPPLDPPNKNED